MTYKVLASDVQVNMVLHYYGRECKVIDIYRGNQDEIGFTLLERGKSEPQMFTMTARPKEPLYVSLKYLLQRL